MFRAQIEQLFIGLLCDASVFCVNTLCEPARRMSIAMKLGTIIVPRVKRRIDWRRRI